MRALQLLGSLGLVSLVVGCVDTKARHWYSCHQISLASTLQPHRLRVPRRA